MPINEITPKENQSRIFFWLKNSALAPISLHFFDTTIGIKMLKLHIFAVTISACLFSVHCAAAEWSGYRTIQSFGCHMVDGTCYMNLDGAPLTGASGCTANSIRWDAKNDPNGKAWLALVMLAKSTNKRIAINVDGCYSNQSSFPTFTYGEIEG